MVSLVGVDTAVTRLSIGAVVSILKELTGRLLLGLLSLSVTVMMQARWAPSSKALKVIVLLSDVADVVELLQVPT